MSEDVRPWWQHAVIYQVYPRSFADSDHDGVGDLSGIAEKLDHIRALGADAVWISPVYRSPMADAGYDISDHCDIDPVFGTLADMDVLIEQAHARGLRVLLDFVPNHTSEEHPWFRDARSSRDSPRRDWYIWRDEPNNWRAALDAGSAWTWDASTEQYYLHLFLPAQPDLNWRNPEVVDAMHGVLRFWLDRGVDGLDAGDVPKGGRHGSESRRDREDGRLLLRVVQRKGPRQPGDRIPECPNGHESFDTRRNEPDNS